MTAVPESTRAASGGWLEGLAVYLRPRVLVVMFLGFASGLPLALSGSTLLIWARESGVDLGTIGLFSLVGTPYTLKFLWAPAVDALDVPILSRLLGRRRGWLVFSQLLLMAAIVFLGFTDPAKGPWLVAFGALLVAAASATQDIVIDTFRVESLAPNEQAAGTASYVAAYRIGMLVSTAGALFLVTAFEGIAPDKAWAWTLGYMVTAAFMLIGIAATLFATEPEKSAAAVADHAAHTGENPATRVFRTAYGAFREFFTRDMALAVLLFIVFYKFCDAFAGTMTAPFVIDLGFSRNDYAAIVKGVGLAGTLIGGFVGGALAGTMPMVTMLWIGVIVQAASNLVFSWLAFVGTNYYALTAAIIAENFAGAVGTVIFVAYLSALCKSPLHTATQFALLTALANVARIYLSSGAGFVAQATGWPLFFALSTMVAVPSFILLAWMQARGHFETLAKPRVVRVED